MSTQRDTNASPEASAEESVAQPTELEQLRADYRALASHVAWLHMFLESIYRISAECERRTRSACDVMDPVLARLGPVKRPDEPAVQEQPQ